MGVSHGMYRNLIGDIRSVSHSQGATLIQTHSDFGGVSLGGVLAIGVGDRNIPDWLYQHEYGHYLQSNMLGFGYIPGVAIPSIISAGFHGVRGWNHLTFGTEAWADKLGNQYFRP